MRPWRGLDLAAVEECVEVAGLLHTAEASRRPRGRMMGAQQDEGKGRGEPGHTLLSRCLADEVRWAGGNVELPWPLAQPLVQPAHPGGGQMDPRSCPIGSHWGMPPLEDCRGHAGAGD